MVREDRSRLRTGRGWTKTFGATLAVTAVALALATVGVAAVGAAGGAADHGGTDAFERHAVAANDAQVDGESDETETHTLEVVPGAGDATYRVEVTGSIEGAHVNDRDTNPDDEIGESTVTGQVAAGYDGDSYRFTGEIVDLAVVEGDAEFRVDGEPVEQGDASDQDDAGESSDETDAGESSGESDAGESTDEGDAGETTDESDGGDDGDTAPSVEFIDCTSAEVTGEYSEVEVEGYWNVRDGVDTGIRSLSQADVEANDGVVDTDAYWDDSSLGGTVISTVTVYDENYQVLAEATRADDGCDQRARSDVNVSVANVEATGDGTHEVTFAAENGHDTALYVQPQNLQGSVADDESPPTEIAPGRSTFTVEWTPDSEDATLTWLVGLNRSFVGFETPRSATTDAASAYGDGEEGENTTDGQDEHTLEVAPAGEDATYEVVVTGTIEGADVDGRDTNPDDRVGESVAIGEVGAGYDGDSYRYTGEIIHIAVVDGDAEFRVDDEQIDPESAGEDS